MNNYQQNQQSEYVDVYNSRRNFNVILLGISLILLLSMAPYWLGVRENSALFIIRQRLDPFIDTNSVPMFFAHLFVTLIALWVYYTSGSSKALADRIAYTDEMMKLFDEQKQLIKRVQDFTKILAILIIVLFSYFAIMDLLRGTRLPILECNIIFVTYVLAHLILKIEEKENNIHKRTGNFNLEKFHKKLADITIFKNIDGEIKGELSISPKFLTKSEFISARNKSKQIEKILEDSTLQTIISEVLSVCDIDQDIEQRRLHLEAFKDRILENGATFEENRIIEDKTSSVELTKKIISELHDKINEKIGTHPFIIKFSITKDSIKDKLLSEKDEARRRNKEDIETRRKELIQFIEKTISETSSPHQRNQLIGLRLELQGISNINRSIIREIQLNVMTIQSPDNTVSFQQSHHPHLHTTPNIIEKNTDSIITITQVLYGKTDRELREDAVKEQLSGTSVFNDHKISIDQFIEVINEKWGASDGEKNKDSYKQLVGEVLSQLSKN